MEQGELTRSNKFRAEHVHLSIEPVVHNQIMSHSNSMGLQIICYDSILIKHKASQNLPSLDGLGHNDSFQLQCHKSMQLFAWRFHEGQSMHEIEPESEQVVQTSPSWLENHLKEIQLVKIGPN